MTDSPIGTSNVEKVRTIKWKQSRSPAIYAGERLSLMVMMI